MIWQPATPSSTEVRIATGPDYDVAAVVGDLDLCSYQQVRSVLLDPSTIRAPVLIIDLSELTFMDARGITLLVEARRWCMNRGRTLMVVCPEGGRRKLLRITLIDQILTVVPTLDVITGTGA